MRSTIAEVLSLRTISVKSSKRIFKNQKISVFGARGPILEAGALLSLVRFQDFHHWLYHQIARCYEGLAVCRQARSAALGAHSAATTAQPALGPVVAPCGAPSRCASRCAPPPANDTAAFAGARGGRCQPSFFLFCCSDVGQLLQRSQIVSHCWFCCPA